MLNHKLLDKYTNKGTVVHRIDARLKIICTLIAVLALVSTPATEENYIRYVLYFLLISPILLLAKLPITYALSRSLVILPFVVIPASAILFTPDGLTIFFNVSARAWLSALTITVFSSTTSTSDFMRGMRALKAPKIFVDTTSFMLRYLNLLTEEVLRMKAARDARNHGRKPLWHIKAAGNIIGSLFIRSYSRAERIYYAMLARGYSGEIKTIKSQRIKAIELIYSLIFLVSVAAIEVI